MASLSRTQLDQFRSLIADRLGLQFDNGKMEVLADVFRHRVDAQHGIRPDDYLAILAARAHARAEWRTLASCLTVAETYFFRVPEHFRAMAEVVLPAWRRANPHRPFRLLSAGCASGDEAYSLAILVREQLPQVAQSQVVITGFDINPAMLAKAQEGRYSPWSLRETPPEVLAKYFHAQAKEFVLDVAIRSMVRFEERNLVSEADQDWDLEQFDLIFCRNVIMYMVPEAAQIAVARLTRALAPAGFLFLSPAETLRGISQDFHLRHTHDTFYYQKREGAGTQPEAVSESGPAPAPVMPNFDVSWIEAVRRASEHIESLSRVSTTYVQKTPTRPGAAIAVFPGPQRAPLQLSFALELLRQEKFLEALEVISKLPSEAASDVDVQLLRAVLLTNCGDVPGAEAVCQQLLRADDLNAGAHYVAALCREHAGDLEAAREHDSTAVYLDPTFAIPHLHLGLMARRAEDLRTARREFEKASVLLLREDASRILLLGGGFSREVLLEFSRVQLRTCGGQL